MLFKKAGLVAGLGLLMVTTAPEALAQGVGGQMEDFFADQMAFTEPGAAMTGRRGVITGGRFSVRNRVTAAPNLVKFSLPSASAGCNGFDLHGGSFSFIDKDQFIAIMREIPSAAVGVLFQIALSAASEKITGLMGDNLKRIEKLSLSMMNACEIAQFGVGEGARLTAKLFEKDAGNVAQSNDIAEDTFDAHNANATGTTSAEHVANAAPGTPDVDDWIYGNLVWRQLKKNDVSGWFASGGDDELLEFLMTAVGTVIISEAINDGDPDIRDFNPNLHIMDVMLGGVPQEVDVFNCDTTGEDGCLNPTLGPVTVEPFEWQVLEMFNDILPRLANGTATDADHELLTVLPLGLHGELVRLSTLSPKAMRMLAEVSAPMVAFNLSGALMRDMYQAVEQAADGDTSAGAKLVKDNIRDAYFHWYSRRSELAERIGRDTQVIDDFKALMSSIPKQRFAGALIDTGAVPTN